MQNSDIRTRITSLNRSQTSPMVFAFKTAPLAPDLKVSMGPNPHLWFCTLTTATLWPELIVSFGPRLHLSFCACETVWLAPESPVSMGPRPHLSFSGCKTSWLASGLLVSIGPSPHLWFLLSKQRLLNQNNKSLCVPDLTWHFVHVKQRD